MLHMQSYAFLSPVLFEAGFLNNHFFGTWNFPTKGGSRKILEIGFFEKVWTYPFVGCNFGRNELWWIFWTVSESHRFINIFLNHSYQLSQNKSMQKLFLWNILIFKQKLLHVLKLVVGIRTGGRSSFDRLISF